MRAIPAKYVDVPTALWAANKDLVELGESFPTSIYYLLAKFGLDTAENEPLKVHLIIQPWDLIFTEPPRPGGA